MKTETASVPLRDLVDGFHRGTILLPQFQRDYVWKPNKIRNLLDSLLRDFPIGGFYLWVPEVDSLGAKPKAYGKVHATTTLVGYLIDGQQRLTSLEAAFGLYAGEDKRGAELRCYLDLAAPEAARGRDTRLFVSYAGRKSVARRVEAGDSTLIPLILLWEGENFDLRKSTEEALHARGWKLERVENALARFDRACKMLNQLVPRTSVMNVSDRDAVEVFSRLNKGGSALREGDVRAAELASGRAVDVLRRMREFVSSERPRRLGFGFSFAFRALVVFHRGSAQFRTLKADWIEAPGPFGRKLAGSWKATERALEEAFAFVDQRMGWSRRALLPSANAVIVLAAALDKADLKINSQAEQRYRAWLCLTALRGVFQGSVETTINRFLRAIRESTGEPAKALVDALKRDGRKVRPDEFNTNAQLWGPATQVMHAWLVGQEAKDWLKGESIDGLARNGARSLPGGDLTVHHIFAREVMKDFADNPDDVNKPANYALLSRSTNAEFGDKRANEVLATLLPEQRKLADIQFFGDAAGDRLVPQQYEEFCEWRAARLAKSINAWIGID